MCILPSLAEFLNARHVAEPIIDQSYRSATGNVNVCIVCGNYVAVPCLQRDYGVDTWQSMKFRYTSATDQPP